MNESKLGSAPSAAAGSVRAGGGGPIPDDAFGPAAVHDARVFEAGDSLAIRIPSTIAKRIALEDGVAVELAVDHGMLYVRKAPSRELADLIVRITPENLHEPLFDEPVGAEIW